MFHILCWQGLIESSSSSQNEINERRLQQILCLYSVYKKTIVQYRNVFFQRYKTLLFNDCLYACRCICLHVGVNKRTYKYSYVGMNVYRNIFMCIHLYLCVCLYIYISILVCVYVWFICVHNIPTIGFNVLSDLLNASTPNQRL